MEAVDLIAVDLDDGDDEDLLVREWRIEQLSRLGVTRLLAALHADRVDWHEIAGLVTRGCPPVLALEIVL